MDNQALDTKQSNVRVRRRASILGVNAVHPQNNWPIAALLISAGLLGGAYGFQYIGGFNPCQMCYWQRHAHKAVIAVSALAIMASLISVSKALKRLLLGLIMVCFLVSFGLAFWHVGVEYGWFEGPKSCAVIASAPGGFSVDGLRDALSQPIEAPACSDVSWSILGLSMAGWNALISLIAAFMSAYVIRKA